MSGEEPGTSRRPLSSLCDPRGRPALAWIKADRWVGFGQAEVGLSRLNSLLSYPPRDRMPCLLLYGETGMGKHS